MTINFKPSVGNLSPLPHAAFKMDDPTGVFEFYSSDRTEEAVERI